MTEAAQGAIHLSILEKQCLDNYIF